MVMTSSSLRMSSSLLSTNLTFSALIPFMSSGSSPMASFSSASTSNPSSCLFSTCACSGIPIAAATHQVMATSALAMMVWCRFDSHLFFDTFLSLFFPLFGGCVDPLPSRSNPLQRSRSNSEADSRLRSMHVCHLHKNTDGRCRRTLLSFPFVGHFEGPSGTPRGRDSHPSRWGMRPCLSSKIDPSRGIHGRKDRDSYPRLHRRKDGRSPKPTRYQSHQLEWKMDETNQVVPPTTMDVVPEGVRFIAEAEPHEPREATQTNPPAKYLKISTCSTRNNAPRLRRRRNEG
mmetsp:Transcript_8261/g.51430  ORF Transcript_8261/g.51430 Transcript_8261/m.51430 type:complete len:288 (-) Transcript_8261:2298-3161(-)